MVAGQGLIRLLQRRSRPYISCFTNAPSEGDSDASSILIVDGQAVFDLILTRVAAKRLESDSAVADCLYLMTCRFMVGLKRCGLRIVAVLPASFADVGSLEDAGSEPNRRAAFCKALGDLQLETRWSSGSHHHLILDIYRTNRAEVEAVLTSDAGYFVYGVRSICLVDEVLVDRDSTTLVKWDSGECWRAWQSLAEGQICDLNTVERAQVAVLLGVRVPSADGEGSAPGPQLLCSASAAARMALAFAASDELPLSFFQEVMGLSRFGEAELQDFRRAVSEMLSLAERTRSGRKQVEGEADSVETPSSYVGGDVSREPCPQVAMLLDPPEDSLLAEEHTNRSPGFVAEIGSNLVKSEWFRIQDKDTISKTRQGSNFKTIKEIENYDPNKGGASSSTVRIDEESVWRFMYSQRKDDKIWKHIAEATFPIRWAAARDKSMEKSALSELRKTTKESVLESVDQIRDRDLGARTKRFLQLLPGDEPEKMLALRREAVAQGPNTVAWKAAEACWNHVPERIRKKVLLAMFSCSNKAAAVGKPRRYPHQEELLKSVHEHLSKASNTVDDNIPLHIELSTPTGSGKTLAALMLHLQLLKPRHPDAVLVYSVPTKGVLMSVGQACEAHSVIYWTAAAAGGNFEVRRPYSVRTLAIRQKAGAGDMLQQLQSNMAEGKENLDRGGGRPQVIVADIFATVALLETAREARPSDFFHSSNLVLYFDEPNMGVHIDENIRQTVQNILRSAPWTMVLASATLPPWSALPSWWRMHGERATRATITLEPYELPQAKLSVLDGLRQELKSANILSLFSSHDEFCETVRGNKRLQIILLRHLTESQGLDLLGASADGDHIGFGYLYGELSMLREALEANLADLLVNKERFEALRSKWAREESTYSFSAGSAPPVSGVISKTGITLIATQNPRKLALELAGFNDKERWSERVHRLNSERASVARQNKEAERERSRRKRDDAQEDDGTGTGLIRLREGIQVTVAEADEADQDELLMLGSGIAYSTAAGATPLVQSLYQQTLLSMPEQIVGQTQRLPPIHVLVVDYSSIYGTDCPAVDTLVMMEDLGAVLTWEDQQQFMGRLRRDGRAIFCSTDTLRRAVVRVGQAAASGPVPGTPRAIAAALLRADASGTTPAQIRPELEEQRKTAGLSAGEFGCALSVAMFGRLLGAPPDAGREESQAYRPAVSAAKALASAKAAVERWGPLVRLYARKDAEQAQILSALQSLAEGMSDWGEAGRVLLDLSPRLLKALYDEDVVSEDAVLAWEDSAKAKTPDSRFLRLAAPFTTWLREAEEDSDEEEEEDGA